MWWAIEVWEPREQLRGSWQEAKRSQGFGAPGQQGQRGGSGVKLC